MNDTVSKTFASFVPAALVMYDRVFSLILDQLNCAEGVLGPQNDKIGGLWYFCVIINKVMLGNSHQTEFKI